MFCNLKFESQKQRSHFLLRHISPKETSFKYARIMQLLRRKSLEKEGENKNTEQPRSNSKNYTIFHALVETMVKNSKMENIECILCGTCIDGCEFNVIRFAFLNGSKKRY